MVHVSPLTDKTLKNFKKLFADYYRELDCEDDVPHLLDEYVIPDLKAGLIRIEILKDGETFAGFIIYQKDDVDNDWRPRIGWGDVREIYVIPSARRQGLGKLLLYTAEMKLKESGADKCYCLPAEGTEEFFVSCGYARGNLYNEELDCFVYEKTNSDNKCK